MALRASQEAGEIHIVGDQHLATVVKHGIAEHRDGPWAFVIPAIVNNYFSRWWWPEDEQSGATRGAESTLPWTGDYLDGSGKNICLYAYANPDTPSFGSGYGLIRFIKSNRSVNFECWPRNTDVTEPGATRFKGWPISIEPTVE